MQHKWVLPVPVVEDKSIIHSFSKILLLLKWVETNRRRSGATKTHTLISHPSSSKHHVYSQMHHFHQQENDTHGQIYWSPMWSTITLTFPNTRWHLLMKNDISLLYCTLLHLLYFTLLQPEFRCSNKISCL